jgi:hypothetical protein
MVYLFNLFNYKLVILKYKFIQNIKINQYIIHSRQGL